MRKSWLLCALLGTLAFGQAAPGTPPPPQPGPAQAENEGKPPADTSASVPATAAVITINGVCAAQPKTAAPKGATAKPTSATTKAKDDDDDKPAPAAGCKTVITKAEFEKLANALAPNTTAQQRKQLAGVLPRVIAMSTEAKKEGLDKTPQYDETVKFVRMQVLTNQLQRKIQEEAAEIPPAEIEKYYKEHPDQYEQYNVDRIFVPRTKQVEAEAEAKDEETDEKMTDEQKKAKETAEKAKTDAAEQAMTKLADEIRAKAAAGGDMSKLQKEAFDAAGMKIESPTVNLPSVRRTGLPPAHAAIFDLKPGDVSQVIGDSGGHYIYKMNSKSEMTLDQARSEIKGKMQNDRMRERMEKLNNSYKVDTNEAYFGPGGAGPMPPPRMGRPRPGMPPAGAAGQQPAPPSAQPAPQKQ